jgi:hypothetical protein
MTLLRWYRLKMGSSAMLPLLYKGNIKRLKPLVALLELWWGSKQKLELPKGGLDTPCSLVFARVHSVLEIAPFCSLRVVFYRCCSPALLYGLLYKQMLYSSV